MQTLLESHKRHEKQLCGTERETDLGTEYDEDSPGNNISLSGNLDLPTLPLIAFNGPIVMFAEVESGIYGESWFLELCQEACG